MFCHKVWLNLSLPAKVIADPHVVTICVTFCCSQQQGAEALIPNLNQEEETWDDDLTPVSFHTLPLPQSSIFVVDTEESLEEFLAYIKVSAVMNNLILHYVLYKQCRIFVTGWLSVYRNLSTDLDCMTSSCGDNC
jgi:hypothetical protein